MHTPPINKMLFIGTLLFSIFAATSSAADTIYQCRAYNGESFWASDNCQKHQALVEGIHTVPANMPFQQQVDLAHRGVSKKNNTNNATNEERVRAAQCASINEEIKQLQSKYLNWQYVPIEQVNADQTRQRDLNSRRASLRCYQ